MVEQHAEQLQAHVRELEQRLEEETKDSGDLDVLRQRLTESMEDERKQHEHDIEERDFRIDQMRKTYQGASVVKSPVSILTISRSRTRGAERRCAFRIYSSDAI